MPKNSGIGPLVGGASFLLGFGLTWHIWWLAAVGFVGVVTFLIVRLSDDDTDYYVTVDEINKIEIESSKVTLKDYPRKQPT